MNKYESRAKWVVEMWQNLGSGMDVLEALIAAALEVTETKIIEQQDPPCNHPSY